MRTFELYCNEIQNVENYEQAKADNFKGWDCHHRLETHTSDGERRLIDLTPKELIALDMYCHRPANELIFMLRKEHTSLHKKGRHLTKEQRKKISETLMRHPVSEENRKKLSEISKGNKYHKGKHHSEEAKRKMSNAKKGKHWKLVDGKRIWYGDNN